MKIILLKLKMMKKKMETKYEYFTYLIFLIQDEGMNIDLNKAMKDCEGIEKVQERTNAGVVSFISIIIFHLFIYLLIQRQKFDSATYEKNKQEQGKK